MKDVGSPTGQTLSGNRKTKWWFVWAQNLVGGAIICGFLLYLWEHREQLLSAEKLPVLDVGLIACLIFLTWFINAVQGYMFYRASGLKIHFLENFVLANATTFGNYLPARAGTLIRAHYLKSIHGLRYARYGSILGIRTVLTIIAAGIAGLSGTLWLAFSGGKLSIELIVVFSLLVIIPFALFLWRPKVRTSNAVQSRLLRIWFDFAVGFHDLKARPGLSFAVIFLILLQYATLFARFSIAAHATDAIEPLSLPLLALLAPLAALMGFVSITPGGLGVREAVMGYATFAAGASFSEGMFVGAIDRAVLLALVAVFGGPCFLWIWVRVRRKAGKLPET